MNVIIVAIVALLLSVSLIWVAEFEPGFVLLQYGSWSIETSLVLFVIAFVLLVITAYMTLSVTVLMKKAPKRLGNWRAAIRHKNAHEALHRGLIAFEEGRWAYAERVLMRHVNYSDVPLLHYSIAAKAAQKQEAFDRRDQHLDRAKRELSDATVAIELTRAELQLQAKQNQQALLTLQSLNINFPKHPYVLAQLKEGYACLEQWHDVSAVLPDLRKRNVLPSSAVNALSIEAIHGQMQNALDQQDWDDLYAVWQGLSAKLRHTESILLLFVKGLTLQNKPMEAITLIINFMNRSWSDSLVYHYGFLLGEDGLSQLAKAEQWLKEQPDNPVLLLTLGRLAVTNELWGQAEDYLRKSIDIEPRAETYQLLGMALEAEGQDELVADVYKKGLALALANQSSSEK